MKTQNKFLIRTVIEIIVGAFLLAPTIVTLAYTFGVYSVANLKALEILSWPFFIVTLPLLYFTMTSGDHLETYLLYTASAFFVAHTILARDRFPRSS